MTTKLTREWLQDRIANMECYGVVGDEALILQAYRMALAAMDSEPVAEVLSRRPGNDTSTIDRALPVGTQLYRHAQPAPVVPEGLNPETTDLVLRFASALADKLYKAEQKYGRSTDWMKDDWYDDCLQSLWEHIEKGDPRDVAAYCAFMWYHGWVTTDYDRNVQNACRAAMLQESQKSAGESNNCRRSEKVQDLLAGNCRENGNSSTNNFREIAETSTGTAITPAAPDKKLTDDVQRDAKRWRALLGSARIRILGSAGFDATAHPGENPDYRHFGMEIWTHYPNWLHEKNEYGIDTLTQYADAMLAAAPQPQNEPQNIPEIIPGWIPVSERMPPSRYEVLVGRWWGEKPRWCCKWATYIPGHPDSQSSGWLIPGASWTPTHWMPLPAAPQEVR